MKNFKGDILELAPLYAANAVVVPLTGYVKKSGLALMGGISKSISDRFKPEADLGEALNTSNGGVCIFGNPGGIKLVAFPDRPKGRKKGESLFPYQLIDKVNHKDFIEQSPSAPNTEAPPWQQTWRPVASEGETPVARYDVPRWVMKPTMSQLSDSLHQLVALTNTEGWERVLILRPSHPLPMQEVVVKMEEILNNRFGLVTLR